MTIVNDTIEAGGAMSPATVKVWDPFVRVFHWLLASLFVLAYATGDETEKVHIAAGYTIATLIPLCGSCGALLVRGMRGSRTSSGPRARCLAIRTMPPLLRAPRYLGHNPAGGAMIIAPAGTPLRDLHHRLHDDDQTLSGSKMGRRRSRSHGQFDGGPDRIPRPRRSDYQLRARREFS